MKNYTVTRTFAVGAHSQQQAEMYVDLMIKPVIRQDPSFVAYSGSMIVQYQNLQFVVNEGWYIWEADYPSKRFGPYQHKMDAMQSAQRNDIILIPIKG